MKVKKIAKRLRKISAEFHTRALNYDGETKEAECSRLFTIADVCQMLADEVFTASAVKRNKKGNQRGPIVPVRGVPVKGQDGWNPKDTRGALGKAAD